LQEVRIDHGNCLSELAVIDIEGHPLRHHMSDRLNPVDMLPYRAQQGKRDLGTSHWLASRHYPRSLEPVEMVCIRKPRVVREFLAHKQRDEDRAREPDGKSG